MNTLEQQKVAREKLMIPNLLFSRYVAETLLEQRKMLLTHRHVLNDIDNKFCYRHFLEVER